MFDSPKFDPRVITTTSRNSTAGLKKIIASMYIISRIGRVRLVRSNQCNQAYPAHTLAHSVPGKAKPFCVNTRKQGPVGVK